jgi:competence protein ComEC
MKDRFLRFVFGFLILISALVWLVVFSLPDSKFHLVACSVGQGDAILAYYKDTQVLIDGGPGNKVLDCLSSYMPFWDRKIEMVVLTHPEADHFSGLVEVFKRYKVEAFLASSLNSGSQGYQLLKDEVGSSGASVILPDKGKIIGVGLMRFVILHPSADFLAENSSLDVFQNNNQNVSVLGARTTNRPLNEFSINLLLSFENFDALLTGDTVPPISKEVEDAFLASSNLLKDNTVEYIKIPHHGSKNGLTQDLLELIKPKVAIISVGKNSYGHPSPEILEMLKKAGVLVFQTKESGNIEIVADKNSWSIKTQK